MNTVTGVNLYIKSTQDNGMLGPEKSTLYFEGRHYCKGGYHYILYGDSSLLEGEFVQSYLKIGENECTIHRGKPLEENLHFVKEKETKQKYNTPYGSVPLSIKTGKLDIAYADVSGTIHIEYDLMVGDEWQSHHVVDIEVNPADDEVKNLN